MGKKVVFRSSCFQQIETNFSQNSDSSGGAEAEMQDTKLHSAAVWDPIEPPGKLQIEAFVPIEVKRSEMEVSFTDKYIQGFDI